MTALVRWDLATEEEVRFAIVQRVGSASLTYAAAKAGMDELGHLCNSAALDTGYVLRRVEARVNFISALQPLSPAQQAALEQRTQQFLDEMLTATIDAGAEMLNVLVTTRKEI
ncbi:MAG: hypothetical protein IT328_23360 [Caldilineaceae bacterium]|nr:hypothetical protein [Caldilineaceae bacterium]